VSSEHPKNEGIAPRKRRFVVVIAGGVVMVELWLYDCGVGGKRQAAYLAARGTIIGTFYCYLCKKTPHNKRTRKIKYHNYYCRLYQLLKKPRTTTSLASTWSFGDQEPTFWSRSPRPCFFGRETRNKAASIESERRHYDALHNTSSSILLF
jgi:hypothetical protein